MQQRRFEKRKRGRPLKDRRKHLQIAATIDYRGTDDDVLTFVFRGVGQQLITKVFQYLVGHSHGIAREAVVTEEHDIIRRNGKGYWRIAAEIHDPNYHFASLDDMQLLIEATLRRLHPCTVHWMPIEKFLNV